MSRITCRPMTAADIAFGMELKTASGWNQLEADWRRVLDLTPGGTFVGFLDDKPVGTVASTCFGSVAWISMMLVSETARGQGVGKALMLAALDFLQEKRVISVRLDATPLGRPLYEKLGFTLDFDAARFGGVPEKGLSNRTPAGTAAVELLTPQRIPLAAELDQQASATDRAAVLKRLGEDEQDFGWCAVRGDQLAGYQMKRSGANATLIGPCIAHDDDAGAALLNAALWRHRAENVYVDIPLQNEPACRLVRDAGLEVQRPLYRMTRGPKIAEQPQQIWASFGPEKG